MELFSLDNLSWFRKTIHMSSLLLQGRLISTYSNDTEQFSHSRMAIAECVIFWTNFLNSLMTSSSLKLA